MAITALHGTPASSSAAATTFAFQPGISASPGDVLVIIVAQDNGGTSGAQSMTAPTLINSTTGKGTITQRRAQNWDPGAADAGITQGIFDVVLTAPFEATDWVQCNSSTSDRISAHVIRIRPDPGSTLSFGAAGGTTGASTAAPTITTGANVTSGDIIIGAYSGATNAAVTLDSDTSNGNWSAQSSSSSNSGTLGTSTTVAAQTKVVTGTATQTYNPTTVAAADCIVGYVTYTQAAAARTITAWRWYADAAGLGAALAAENTVPVLSGAQNRNVPLRLRVTLRASANLTEALSLQYKTDWSGTWTALPAIGATSKEWPRYANGADTAGGSVTRVLTGADTNGVYIEATASSQTVNAADGDKEFDFAISLRYAPPHTRIYFRINGAGGAWIPTGIDNIALDTPTEADWEDNNGNKAIVSKTFGPNTGADARNFEAYRPHLIYDGTYHWLFYFQEVTEGGAATLNKLYYRYFDGSAWSTEQSMTLTTGFTTLKMYGLSAVFGDNAGTKYVFVAYQSSSTVTRFYRGTISGTSITWGSETSVTTTMDTTSQGCLTISDDGYLFYHGLTTAVTTNIFRAMRSTNPYDISAWGTIADGGGAGARAAATNSDHTMGVSLGNNSVLIFGIDSNNTSAGTLYCRQISGSGGTIAYGGSTVTVNATTNCHMADWSAMRNSSGDIYVIHSDGVAQSDTGALNLRVSQDNGATWTTCTSPSVTMDGTSVDGCWVVDDGARGCYIFYTGAESGSGGNNTEMRYKHYTVTGSAVTSGSWDSSPTVAEGTGMGNGDAIYAAEFDGSHIFAFHERGDDDAVTTLEFYILYEMLTLSTDQSGDIPVETSALVGVTPTAAASSGVTGAILEATEAFMGVVPTASASSGVSQAIPTATIVVSGVAIVGASELGGPITPAIHALQGVTPTAAASSGTTGAITTNARSLTGVMPTAAATSGVTGAIPTATGTLTGITAPGTGTGNVSGAVTPVTAPVIGVTPSRTVSGGPSQAIASSTVVITPVAITAAASSGITAAIPTATHTLVGVTITASQAGGPQTGVIETAVASIVRVVPTAAASSGTSGAIPTATYALAPVSLTASGSGNASVALSVGVITITGVVPTGGGAQVGAITTAVVAMSAVTPTATASGDATRAVSTAVIVLTLVVPSRAGVGSLAQGAMPVAQATVSALPLGYTVSGGATQSLPAAIASLLGVMLGVELQKFGGHGTATHAPIGTATATTMQVVLGSIDNTSGDGSVSMSQLGGGSADTQAIGTGHTEVTHT